MLANSSPADRLRDVAFACAGRPQEKSVFSLADELPGGQLEEQFSIYLLVEVEVEAVQGFVRVPKARQHLARSANSPTRPPISGPSARKGSAVHPRCVERNVSPAAASSFTNSVIVYTRIDPDFDPEPVGPEDR